MDEELLVSEDKVATTCMKLAILSKVFNIVIILLNILVIVVVLYPSRSSLFMILTIRRRTRYAKEEDTGRA